MANAAASETSELPAGSILELGPWSCCAQPAGVIEHPEQLAGAAAQWLPAAVPGTVAGALAANGRWNFDQPQDLDAHDWWFRTSLAAPEHVLAGPCYLCCDGLATLAEVWLNGRPVLATNNMFRAYRVDASGLLLAENELVIAFRSLGEDLKRKRARPRWKTNLVGHQQWRWQRTSLLGRIPGWAPVAPAIGPWREVRLEATAASLHDVHLAPRLEATTGVVAVRARAAGSLALERATIRVGQHEAPLELQADDDGWQLSGEIRIADAPLWWPHTHGAAELCPATIILESATAWHCFPCPAVGFRRLEVDTDDGGFGLRVNGEPVYCRGACWTTGDLLTLAPSEAALRHDLRLARDAGVNMLRVGGTMTYESELFYRLCDELGILVWQDFMFANMDYPVEDAAFRGNITAEAQQQLMRLAPHPCLAVYCGNSEIEQQAAMLGMPRPLWRNGWFADELPALCAELHPGTPIAG
jgi:beta-mannosidase